MHVVEIDFAITNVLGFIAPQIILAMFIQMVQLISKRHVFCLFYACINHKRLLCMVDKVFLEVNKLFSIEIYSLRIKLFISILQKNKVNNKNKIMLKNGLKW